MKRSFKLSLGQTVMLAASGGLLMACTFPLMAFAHLDRDHGSPIFWLRLLLSGSPVILGGFISVKANAHLKDGIANEQWPAENVASFRGIFESIIWRIVVGLLLIGSCIALFAIPHHRALGWFLLVLGQSIIGLTHSLFQSRRQPPPSDDWRNRPALHSQQWGQR